MNYLPQKLPLKINKIKLRNTAGESNSNDAISIISQPQINSSLYVDSASFEKDNEKNP